MSSGKHFVPPVSSKSASTARQDKCPDPAPTLNTTVTPAPHLTGTQLATAFDGKLERAGTSFGYRMAPLLVAGMMLLMPAVYIALIAAAAWLTISWAGFASGMFEHLNGGYSVLFALVIFVAPIVAGALLVVSMLLSMFWRSKKGPKPIWVDRREQPLLYAYIERLSAVVGALVPARIDVLATADASAHMDNGIFGLFHRRMVLTIGLPLVSVMDLQQFTGVLAHELGHFSQGIYLRLSFVVHRINSWFGRMAFGRSGIDDILDSVIGHETHWTATFIAGMCKLVLWLARLITMAMALLSRALSMHLSRQAEYDADRQAARIVGSEPLGAGLQILPAIGAANSLAISRAQARWAKRELPDDLVLLTTHFNKTMPQSLRDKLEAQILSRNNTWFDTHPPLFQRVAALKKAKFAGVMKINAPATEVFRDFDELCKIATIDLYSDMLGKALQPEHLVTTVLPSFESEMKQRQSRRNTMR